MKKILLTLLWVILIPIVLFGVFLIYSTLFEYTPADQEIVFNTEESAALPESTSFTAMTWNFGFTGLGANMDFFYDGGEKVRDSKENVSKNLGSITRYVAQYDTVDFLLLQEVDLKSKRSYYTNHLEALGEVLPEHQAFLGLNYVVDFVPIPVKEPFGKIKSGLVTYSKYLPRSSVRHSYHGNYKWPMSTFMLKRCYLVNRYPLSDGREFLLINLHNSAYDDGSLRAAQLEQLSAFVEGEYNKGNYVFIGGDWNQCPTDFIPRMEHVFDTVTLSYLPADFLKGWEQVYSDTIPTNRRIMIPYDQSKTPTTLIDFYIVSPNIEIESVWTEDLSFENTDHNPVFITFRLK